MHRDDNVGIYGLGKTNKNAQILLEYARSNNMKIAGTFFKKRMERKWTWISPNREVKNKIDHLLTNNMSIVKDICISVVPKFEFASDHRMCRGIINIPKRDTNLTQK